MDRKNIDKITDNPEERLLLAKLWDKIHSGMQKNIPASTGFLSAREISLAKYLFGQPEGLHLFGGFEAAERKMLVYLPEYLSESTLWDDDSPVVCIRAQFYHGETPSHRDFLGALMGIGITRESVGDILVNSDSCDFLVTRQIAPYILQNLESAGRIKLKLTTIALPSLQIPEQKFTQIKDTVASVRLDSIVASGFQISRSAAAEYILAGKAAINSLYCDKPDKAVEETDKISVRGLGKIEIHQIGHITKKGRIMVIIHRYE